jgi:GABA(A) receptor-associated protein
MKHDAEFDKRCTESRRILSKYPDRVPVIVDRNPRAKNTLPEIEKKKFLVPV